MSAQNATVGLLARSYTHPSLEGRTLVRLVRQNLREVEDLSLDVLGLRPDGEQLVGEVANRAIGFPAWPIINDPANARHALNLVQDLQRAAKEARSSAKLAKDRLDVLAATLGGSAPHFLPTFLEEGARVFLRNDNATYAAQYFSKAREAERVHNLAVDEQRHQAVLLEFALAGALSAKELTNESKGLLKRTTPQQALDLFVRLNVDRVKGGLPPYANLGTDLRRLAKAAGADPAGTERALLEQLLGAPALRMAPGGFWKSYLPALTGLAQSDPAVRESLTDLVPESVAPDDWIGVLEAVGVADDLRAGRRDVAAWASSYIRKMQSQYSPGYPRKLALLLRECPSLAGQHVHVGRMLWRLEPEVVDAVLAVGGVVDYDPQPGWSSGMSLARWAQRDERPDLDALAADEQSSALVLENYDRAVAEHLDILVAHSGTRALLTRWACSRLPHDPTLTEVKHELKRLGVLFSPDGYAVVGEQLSAFVDSLDAAELLAGALRHGTSTELTWPALERAGTEVLAESKPCCRRHAQAVPSAHEAWPAIGVSAGGAVAFVDGDDVVAHARFTPKGGRATDSWPYTLIDGVVGCLYDTDGEWNLVWSNDPGTPRKHGWHWNLDRRTSCTFEVPGGRLSDSGLQRVGDAKAAFDEGRAVLHEGTGYWGLAWDGGYEIDPATGKHGRKSLPTRLADLIEPFVREGHRIESAMWLPTTEHTADSLLGVHEGQHGWVALLDERRQLRYLSVDGETHDDFAEEVAGRVRRPGGGHWALGTDGKLMVDRGRSALPRSRDAAGNKALIEKLPIVGWHQLRTRDEAVSVRMRAMAAGDVADLLAATAARPEAGRKDWEPLSGDALVAAERLLGTSDPALTSAACWLAVLAHEAVADAAALRDRVTPGAGPGRFAAWTPGAEVYRFAAEEWGNVSVPRSDLVALGVESAGGRADTVNLSSSLWVPMVHPEVVLALAAAPLQPATAIQSAAALVGGLDDAGLLTGQGAAFTYEHDELRPVGRRIADGSSAVVIGTYWVGHSMCAIAVDPAGTVPPKVGKRATEQFARSGGVSGEAIIAGFEKLLADGPPAWDPDKARQLADGTGWTTAAAAIFLTGLQGLNAWQKNFLPKGVRELIGVKVAEAAAARQFLTSLGTPVLVALLSAGARDPERVLSDGLDVDAIIAAWREHDTGVRLPEDLEARLAAALGRRMDESFATLLADPVNVNAWQVRYMGLPALLWLAAELDRSDPLRDWVADRIVALRGALLTDGWTFSDYAGEARTALGLPAKPEKGTDGPYVVGAWTLTCGKHSDELVWKPGLVTDWEAEAKLVASVPEYHAHELLAMLPLLAEGYPDIVADLRETGEGSGRDPLVTAPGIVGAASSELGVPEDSARYWLQLLALPNPTDRNIDAWNGWKKADRVRAAAPLLEKGLLIEARRARAGRTLFLPGGWQEASTPHLPMEVWKAPFFDLRDAAKVTPADQLVVPRVPLGQLFADAWERYSSGDAPGYVELRTERYRRRRS